MINCKWCPQFQSAQSLEAHHCLLALRLGIRQSPPNCSFCLSESPIIVDAKDTAFSFLISGGYLPVGSVNGVFRGFTDCFLDLGHHHFFIANDAGFEC